MTKSEFIATPINVGAYRHFSDYDHPNGWEKRARKLQDRRWRKIANQMMGRDESVHLRPKHMTF